MLCVLFANNYEQDEHINDVISSEHDEKKYVGFRSRMLASIFVTTVQSGIALCIN